MGGVASQGVANALGSGASTLGGTMLTAGAGGFAGGFSTGAFSAMATGGDILESGLMGGLAGAGSAMAMAGAMYGGKSIAQNYKSAKPKYTVQQNSSTSKISGRPGFGMANNRYEDGWIELPGGRLIRINNIGGEEFQVVSPSKPNGNGFVATGPQRVIQGDAISAGLANGWDVDLANTISLGATAWSAGFGAKGINSPVANQISMSLSFVGIIGSGANLYLDYQKGGGIKNSSYFDFAANLGTGALSYFSPGWGAGTTLGYSAFYSSPSGEDFQKWLNKW